MKRLARIAIAALMVGLQVSVVALAQESGPKSAPGRAGPSSTTESGVAGGVLSPALTGERRPLYRLRQSDVIEISFTFAAEFDQTVTIQPDGFISLKGLEQQMYAQGMTLPQLQAAVRGAYALSLHDPELSVVLKDFDRPYFVAGGEVAHPGKYELRGDTTIVEAVAMAGGFTGQAKHSQVVLFRHVSDGMVEARLLNVKHMLKSRNLREDVYLHPGDMFFVPQNMMSKINRYLPSSALAMYWNPKPF
ncbi:MAG TPA: SLBB domain-containing protein [Terriglobales bacterium]|jgi:polysaccharide export outer membrane protein